MSAQKDKHSSFGEKTAPSKGDYARFYTDVYCAVAPILKDMINQQKADNKKEKKKNK